MTRPDTFTNTEHDAGLYAQATAWPEDNDYEPGRLDDLLAAPDPHACDVPGCGACELQTALGRAVAAYGVPVRWGLRP